MEFLPAPHRLGRPAGELHVWRLAASEAALRRVLAVYLGEEPERIRLREGEHGKPRLEQGAERLEFNLSHSGGLALVAVGGDLPVGVDLERVKPRRGVDHYRGWVRHEAAVKCLGIGLLRARARPPRGVAVGMLEVGAGYAAAVAAAAPRLPPLRGWTFDRALQKAGDRVS